MNKIVNNMNTCNNCGKLGHQFNQCKLPIVSYGIILFTSYHDHDDDDDDDTDDTTNSNKYKFLMIRRKDSFGFIDFIRGKYNICNINHSLSVIL